MELKHEFVVPVPPSKAWDVLMDVQRIAPCMPGASLGEVQGDSFTGRVKIKVGPITVSYNGRAQFVEKDSDALRAVIRADGREERGAGTAGATITAQLQDTGNGNTRVQVLTDLAITGKPAQFGRGVITEVGSALISQFAARLKDEIDLHASHDPSAVLPESRRDTAVESAAGESTGAEPTSTLGDDPTGADASPRFHEAHEDESLDLGALVWRPVLKRAIPIGLGALLLVLLGRSVTRRRRRA